MSDEFSLKETLKKYVCGNCYNFAAFSNPAVKLGHCHLNPPKINFKDYKAIWPLVEVDDFCAQHPARHAILLEISK